MIPKLSQPTSDTALLGRRDAFHVPGVLVSSSDYIGPGDSVQFVDQDCRVVRSCHRFHRHAIVDPFLENNVLPGRLFWVLIIPELVGNLVHHFDIKPRSAVIPELKPEDLKAFLVAYANEEPLPDPKEIIPNDDDEEYDDGCRGCYGGADDEDEDDNTCKGCYD